MIYGNVIIKIPKDNKVKMSKHVSHPQLQKRIGEKVIKHMSIMIKEKFQYSIDGAYYVHPRNKKGQFDLKKILPEIEKKDPHDPVSEVRAHKKKEKLIRKEDKRNG